MRDLPQLACRPLMALSPLGRRQRLSILIYHRVLQERDWMRPGEPTAAEFAWQMRLLKRHFTVLPLGTATELLEQGRLPPRAACVTFDDGYADNVTVALPVLRHHAIPATVFVAAGYLDGGRMWNDRVLESLRQYDASELDLSRAGLPVYATESRAQRRQAAYDIIGRCKYLEPVEREGIADDLANRSGELPDNLMLTSAQLLRLHAQGIEIGGHTLSHPILSSLPRELARKEILGGKARLEAITGAPLRLFAYPNGRPGVDYHQEHVALVKEAGFKAAVATRWGVAGRQSDPFQLPRFTPWDRSAGRFLLRMAMNSRQVAPAAGAHSCSSPS